MKSYPSQPVYYEMTMAEFLQTLKECSLADYMQAVDSPDGFWLMVELYCTDILDFKKLSTWA